MRQFGHEHNRNNGPVFLTSAIGSGLLLLFLLLCAHFFCAPSSSLSRNIYDCFFFPSIHLMRVCTSYVLLLPATTSLPVFLPSFADVHFPSHITTDLLPSLHPFIRLRRRRRIICIHRFCNSGRRKAHIWLTALLFLSMDCCCLCCTTSKQQ